MAFSFYKKNSGVISLRCFYLQNSFGNNATNFRNICTSHKFKPNSTHSGKPQIQFTVEVEDTCAFYRIGLNFTIGQGGEIFFLACESLYIDCNNSLVSENNTIANASEGLDDLLSGCEHRCNHICKIIVVYGF